MILYIMILIILVEYFWDFLLETLNRYNWVANVPEELADIYPNEKFLKQKKYQADNYIMGSVSSTLSVLLILIILGFYGFAWLNEFTINITSHWLWQPLIFMGVIGLGSVIISLPFSYYNTFVIEQRYGFNKTTPAIFWSDTVKSLFIGAIIGGVILGLLIWFYNVTGTLFWLYGWIVITLFMLFFGKFYTTIILPLFNKLEPLEDGELKTLITTISLKANFSLENIYVMDSSKRSTKSNAFFSGFGKNKKIVLFDTLIEELTPNEIAAVLAHEIGHFKQKHIVKSLILGALQNGLMFFLLGWFINEPLIALAFGVKEPSFHIGLLGFGLLYTPISALLGLGMTILSRKNEYEADAFAAKYVDAEYLISALKKISASALSNPVPHPLYVYFNYSHPTLLSRIKALSKTS